MKAMKKQRETISLLLGVMALSSLSAVLMLPVLSHDEAIPAATDTPMPDNQVIYLTATAWPTPTAIPALPFDQGTYSLDEPLRLIAPADQAVITDPFPAFEVAPVPGAIGYEFQVGISPSFDSRVMQASAQFYYASAWTLYHEPTWTPPVILGLTPSLVAGNVLTRQQINTLILRLIDGAADDQEIVWRLYNYVAHQIDVADDDYVLSCDIVLARLGAECGNQQDALGYLYYLLGFPVRKIALQALDTWIEKGYTGAGHTSLEVFVAGQWQITDPYVSFNLPSVSLLEVVDYLPDVGYIIFGREGLEDLTYPRMVSQTGQISYFPYLNSLHNLEPAWHASYSYEFPSIDAVPTAFYDEDSLVAYISGRLAQPEAWTPEEQFAMQQAYVALWHPRQVPEPTGRIALDQTLYWRVRAIMNPQASLPFGYYSIQPGDVTPWSEVRAFTLQTTVPVLEESAPG